ncbi:hypothetical protein ACFLQ6_04930 [Thermoproteota archaeon]
MEGLRPISITCHKCGHNWIYRGQTKGRIHCSVCHSTCNAENHKRFGPWNPEKLNHG